ncbi:MAG: enoyl-CoA hydratase/isomerase family protein [Deltaproteobacteria bacterium]|nr:enoyl-CoA hydratase/isomerase family protein [Deltaproteobacteria bacterium]
MITNLLIEKNAGVAVIKINRPKQLNALNLETLGELEQAIKAQHDDPEIRAIILTGEGKAFVAGADILAMSQMTPTQAKAFAEQGHRTMAAIESCAKPVIAAVNGFCLGGGMELALSCDIILASDQALFGLPEVTLGLFPGWGGTQRLAKLVGRNIAKEFILTGKKYSAEECFKRGIINIMIPHANLLEEATKMAQSMVKAAPIAVHIAKKAINQTVESSLEAGLAHERSEFEKCFQTNDLREGFKAFVEKREPNFQGN